MRRRQGRHRWIVPLGIALGAACPAAAQPRECVERRVDREVDRAAEERLAGRGIEAFNRVTALLARCPSPRVRVQVALAEQSLRRWQDAYLHLREAMASTDPWIVAHREPISRALAEVTAHMPLLAPRANVPGATLRVNGLAVGTLPLPTPFVLVRGAATLEVEAPGHRPARRAVTVGLDEVFDALFTLEPETSPAPAARVVTPAAPPPTARRASPVRAVGWVTVGLGAVLAGLATWQGLQFASISDASARAGASSAEPYRGWYAYSAQTDPAGLLTADALCARAQSAPQTPSAAQARAVCADADAARTLTLGFGLGGAALLVAGVVMVALPARRPPPVALAPWVAPGLAGAALHAAF
ncbi:MAG: PEGA domain-containing protein [Polyangiales bacterium]